MGKIHDFFPRDRLFSIKDKKQVKYYSYKKEYHRYFLNAMRHQTVFVKFSTLDKTKIIRNAPASTIDILYLLSYSTPKSSRTIFSDEEKKDDIKSLINEKRYKMFIDLELTMPPYNETKRFYPEILQIGCVVTDENNNIVNYYSNYVKTNHPISFRTYKFLSLDQEEVDEAISYEDFYNDYKELIEVYNPIVYVWGEGDIHALNNSMKYHELPEIKATYRDLLGIHINYFHFKSFPGLFNALKVYKDINATQVHHALTDAQATKEVFDGFKAYINGDLDINPYDMVKQAEPVEETENKE